ncbi:ATP-binding cassette domain-containing protein [Variovorax sp. PCZ-1]|uniref:ABC transporter ATP-binding protein n=1 Tax=Variovorax sp. PCZ-1 TaxID=2835533 RepID=UPI001BCAAA5A|nr:ATP-binding cassette domain-containing protein [Variovorax sp. PCZ-1]MBS7808572.1 ATP-binding cassette domain-containing protein [Variovorax sp. PCZ-1]
MIEKLRELSEYLPRRRKRQFVALTLLGLVGGVAEIASVGMIVPFLAALLDPTSFAKFQFMNLDWEIFRLANHEWVVLLTTLFCILVLVSGMLRLLVLYANNKFCFAIGHDLSLLAYSGTVRENYSAHTQRNSSEVINVLTTSINEVIFYVILSCLTMISSGLIMVAIATVIVIIVPAYATISLGLLAAVYIALTLSLRSKLQRNSALITISQVRSQKLIQESLMGIREIAVDAAQGTFISLFDNTDKGMRTAQYQNQFMAQSPRFLLEMMGTLVIAGLAFVMVNSQQAGVGAAISILAVMAIGLQRLLPVAQSFYQSWTMLQGARSSLDQTLDLLRQVSKNKPIQSVTELPSMQTSLSLVNVSFKYPDREVETLSNINLTIPKGVAIGVIGKTGAGKSTLIDIVLGLQLPTSGHVTIDGVELTPTVMASWRRQVAHVPQSIFLLDASISENVAFGVAPGAIDQARVIEMCQQVGLDTFIQALPGTYSCAVGERGVQMSGGQRQRLAIARALYKRAAVLVFDEATSALDIQTEQDIVELLYSYRPELTMIFVAHRLATVERCDMLVELVDGQLVINKNNSKTANA